MPSEYLEQTVVRVSTSIEIHARIGPTEAPVREEVCVVRAAPKVWGQFVLVGILLAHAAWSAPPPPESPGAAYRRGDYVKAVKLLKPQAQAGLIDAQIMLGQMYLKGEGIKRDEAQGIGWIQKAASEGSPIAAYDLGVFSLTGFGGHQDLRVAADWFRKAAHQRWPDAAFRLATLYHGGQGVERNESLALNWIDAGLNYLPATAAPDVRARFAVLRDSILAGMSPEQVRAAALLVSSDGPVTAVVVHNREALQKRAVKEYPLNLRQLGWGGNVVILLLVHADGTVGDTLIETSSGYPELDALTQRLVASADVEPRRINETTVESWQILGWAWRATEEPWYSFSRLNALPR